MSRELMRLKVKELAEETLVKFAKRGIVDIFDMLSEEAMLIFMTLETEKSFSGLSYMVNGNCIVFINSSYTLGHQKFTGAHELYHILFNKDILKKEKLLVGSSGREEQEEEDQKANLFAAELLMPEDRVKKLFHKLVKVTSDKVIERHVVLMHNTLQVSYKAMLKRLIELGLCAENLYTQLSVICEKDMAEKLQELTRFEGFKTDLILPTNNVSIPREYVEAVKMNYENRVISYTKLEETLSLINKTTSDYGYSSPAEY